MAFSDIINTALPDGEDDPIEADNNMRRIQGGFQELLDVDHLLAKTGTEISGTDSGEHRKLTIRTLTPTEVAALTATKAYLYRLSTDGELYFKDASDNTIQLTSGGKLLSASLDMKDEDDMASDSASHATTQQSQKAYADAVAAAAAAYTDTEITTAIAAALPDDDAFGTWGGKSDSVSYLAASDGFVCAIDTNLNTYLKGYTDGSNPPTTLRQSVSSYYSNPSSFMMPVKKGDYWKVTGATTIYWIPVGG